MARYHINPETGEPGLCKAEFKCRFGSESLHYTSIEAARNAYEVSRGSFPELSSDLSPGEQLDRARVLVAGPRLDEDTFNALPSGSILIRVHYESDDYSYFVKDSSGKVRGLTKSRGSNKVTHGLAVNDTLFHRGSSGFHLSEPALQTEFTSSQLFNTIPSPEIHRAIATEIHDSIRANAQEHERKPEYELHFDELPEAWQNENIAAAEGALRILRMGVNNHYTQEQLGSLVHKDWLSRNEETAKNEQKLPFLELSLAERQKDYIVLEAVAQVLGKQPK